MTYADPQDCMVNPVTAEWLARYFIWTHYANMEAQ